MPAGRLRILLMLVLLGLVCVPVYVVADWWIAASANVQLRYVGRQSCRQCHTPQAEAFTGSHHDLAQDVANSQTVLGNFDNRELTYQRVTSRVFRRNGKYFFHTEGPDGEMADFEVTHVIGYTPLQQYLIALPDGRWQVSRISWDTLRKRWFYHYPPDVVDERILPDDPLHWTGRMQNWNHMCAECHATDLKKNYQLATDSYHTTFSEIDVSCEACHGPASLHVEQAESASLFWDRNHGYALAKLKGEDIRPQIETCAYCHARRSLVYPGFQAGSQFLDHFRPALLTDGLYHADGQILDEVYVYGSYLQSKMHSKGVRCTDCHDPHSAVLKHEGNQLCTSCHQHPQAKYDTPEHHHHQPGSPGASCVECHMPARYYMIVDPRRDHSLRVPRPDLSVKLGTPNACSGCHLDTAKRENLPLYQDWLEAASGGDSQAKAELERLDRWSLESVRKWYGRQAENISHFADALAAARANQPEGEQLLLEVIRRKSFPSIVRATAVSELPRYYSVDVRKSLKNALSDEHPLVRMAAVTAFAAIESEDSEIRAYLAPRLEDEMRVVRVEAARLLARIRPQLSANKQQQLDAALEEYRKGQQAELDRPEAHMNLGNLRAEQGDVEGALARYRAALRLDPNYLPAKLHTAVLLQQHGELSQAEELLRELVGEQEDAAEAHYWLGLVLARQQKFSQAEKVLRQAHELVPDNLTYHYALAAFYLDLGRLKEAERIARDLIERHPDLPGPRELLNQIDLQRSAGPNHRTPNENE